jgi:hypothetical protein
MKKPQTRMYVLVALSCVALCGLAYADDASNSTSSNSAGQPGYVTQSENPNQQAGKSSSSQKMMSEKEMRSESPKDVCKHLIDAAKNDDFNAVQRWTVGENQMKSDMDGQQAGMSGQSMESKFHQLHKQDMSQLKSLSCGSEKIASNHAFVEAKGQDQQRLIPFVQENGIWKFDAPTYMSFYRTMSGSSSQSSSSNG